MSLKLSRIVGLSFADFNQLLEEKQCISARPARLIPAYKIGDENALTSVFLSALKLIHEFRNEIFSIVGLSKSGKIYIFTEVDFVKLKNDRPDGLIVIVSGGKIKDAALLEVKNMHNEINEAQIQKYLEIAKTYHIPKLITISNQFVSSPTQSPVNIKPPKNISLYHLSWSFIMTIANILLFDNDQNITDPDQVEIMKEVVKYFDHEKSGITGFTSMKSGWKKTIEKVRAESDIKKDDPDVIEAVSSWLQEERDMALILSKKLGLLVKSGLNKYKNDYKGRIEYEIQNLIKNKYLDSEIIIPDAASKIYLTVYFDKRRISFEAKLNPPENKKTRGQIGWIKRQLQVCEKRNPEGFSGIKDNLSLYLYIKYQKKPELVNLNNIDDAWISIKDKEIKNFGIRLDLDLARNFESSKKFVCIIENTLVDFYEITVQNLKEWIKPTPKIVKKKELEIEKEDLE
ncbi:MAG TPA: hypothetical protein DCP10_10130 [Bacteroidales bacterium]|nr:hypothetical protein [Bacteroidales bacterium]